MAAGDWPAPESGYYVLKFKFDDHILVLPCHGVTGSAASKSSSECGRTKTTDGSSPSELLDGDDERTKLNMMPVLFGEVHVIVFIIVPMSMNEFEEVLTVKQGL